MKTRNIVLLSGIGSVLFASGVVLVVSIVLSFLQGIGTALALGAAFAADAGPFPTDAQVREMFQEHRQAFESLKDMALARPDDFSLYADGRLVGPDGYWTGDPNEIEQILTETGLAVQEYERVRVLLNRMEIKSFDVFTRPWGTTVEFAVYNSGPPWFPSKDIVYKTSPPSRIVANTTIRVGVSPRYAVLAEGGWYIQRSD